jgi:hypothetical protein
MADRYYSAPVSASMPANVTEGAAATPGAFCDVRITYDASQASRQAAINAVNAVLGYLVQDNWPPV